MNKLLTIIIPAYNVAEYIEQGIDSLVECNSILDALDIIIINDGSNDNLLDKIEKYVHQYPQCIRIISKENGGHGSVLNKGIKEAMGLYMKVLDGDDWVINEGLVNLVKFIDDNEFNAENIDMIINPFERVYVRKGYKRVCRGRLNSNHGSNLDLTKLCNMKYHFQFAGFTIRSDIFKTKVKWQIDEEISYDDIEFDFFPIAYVNNIIYLDDVIYQYRIGRVRQSVSIENIRKNYWMHEKVLDTCVTYYKEIRGQLDDEHSVIMVNTLVWQIADLCNWYLLRKDKKNAKSDMRLLLKIYNDLPIETMDNKKMKILFKTRFWGYSFISLLYRFKFAICKNEPILNF